VHSEFVSLSVRWSGKIEKGGGELISFFLEDLLLEGKSMSLLKILLLFRCVCEAIVDVLYAALQAHKIINVALHREYSLGIIYV
jgi:hypothetical protein